VNEKVSSSSSSQENGDALCVSLLSARSAGGASVDEFLVSAPVVSFSVSRCK